MEELKLFVHLIYESLYRSIIGFLEAARNVLAEHPQYALAAAIIVVLAFIAIIYSVKRRALQEGSGKAVTTEEGIIHASEEEAMKEVSPLSASLDEATEAQLSPQPLSLGGTVEPELPSPVEVSEARVEEVSQPAMEQETKQSLFSRLRLGLSKTQAGLLGKLDEILSLKKEIDDDLWDDFEETLVMADLGIGTTMKLRSRIERELSSKGRKEPMDIKNALREELVRILKGAQGKKLRFDKRPFVIMVAGVNGVGKTTTIGKLAYMFTRVGKKVMVAAADTFRAAAVEQLQVWANRVGSDFLKGQSGADPSSVAYDAIKASIARDTDILIIDTAGRLHTKSDLMEELKKIKRVISRELEGAPHEVFLVLDATTGQNAIQQAKMFNEALGVTGIILTKLDGTAKGGVIVAIADEFNIPIRYIGIGESLSDLREFEAEDFVEALFLTGRETLH